MDVGGVDQLQTPVVLVLGVLVDDGADEVLLLQSGVVVIPAQLGLGVPGHRERDAPVVVPLWRQQLQDCGGN